MDDRRRDGGTNSTLRTKEQGTHLTLNEHDDDDDDDMFSSIFSGASLKNLALWKKTNNIFEFSAKNGFGFTYFTSCDR